MAINRQELYDTLNALNEACNNEEDPGEEVVSSAERLLEMIRLGDPLDTTPVEATSPSEEGGS